MQVFFEALMVLVFLWARTLARRAVPGDPSKEAKLLIWVIFLGDAFAELVRFRADAVMCQYMSKWRAAGFRQRHVWLRRVLGSFIPRFFYVSHARC